MQPPNTNASQLRRGPQVPRRVRRRRGSGPINLLWATTVVMVLSGGLSNLDRDFFQSLIGDNCRKVRKRRTAARGGWPDGRRAFGSVSGAIVAALAGGGEMKVKTICDEVERLLGGKVSRHSVSDYLLTRSKGPRPLFERARHGHYRLLQ